MFIFGLVNLRNHNFAAIGSVPATKTFGGNMKLKQIISLLLGASALVQASAVLAASIDISAHDIGGQACSGNHRSPAEGRG
jgi:hypothetical protein